MKKIKLDENHKRSIAESCAKLYKQRCLSADLDDMKQEAHVTMLQVEHAGTFDPDRGVDLGAYAYRAAHIQVGRLLWRTNSPVHVPINLMKNVGASGVSMDAPNIRNRVLRNRLLAPSNPERDMELREWRERVADYIVSMARNDMEIVAANALLSGSKTRRLHGRVRKLLRRLCRSGVAKQLMQECP